MRRFLTGDHGGATVEWVVLTVLVVAGVTYMFDPVAQEVQAIAMRIERTLTDLRIPTTFAAMKDFAARGTF
ncbi:hypothetical protein JQC91_10470 [Jannaschia sp. Os4]|uniref:hypothetical protein n=1 Tax=Jannaschia sp. Os4 TaxID=2807617 RepID=UPI001939CD60|nr:hypothetical protein [Jannaschia sp. Os4]MBM2576728.1 hypothetical protein [Jannaschia sp. Os4]